MLEALGAHPDLQEPIPASAPPSPQPFAGLGLSRTLIAFLFSYLFLHLSRPGVCKVWLGRARGFLLGGLQALNQLDLSRADGCKVWIWVWLEVFTFFKFSL